MGEGRVRAAIVELAGWGGTSHGNHLRLAGSGK